MILLSLARAVRLGSPAFSGKYDIQYLRDASAPSGYSIGSYSGSQGGSALVAMCRANTLSREAGTPEMPCALSPG
jgi:hypothetical protein